MKKKYKVEFVSYNGKYPTLCSGILVLKVNEIEYIFEKGSLISGGECYFTDNYTNEVVTQGPWSIDDVYFPQGFPQGAIELAKECINKNITYGCCGGCL